MRIRSPRKSGLSPRVRGNLTGHVLALRPLGSIPACTGEPLAAYRMAQLSGVYPRVYGGTLDLCANGSGYGGLSPRVRGNHHDGSVGSLETRSIPACTGEPPRPGCCQRREWVYPRVCGGTLSQQDAIAIPGGLSPRVRGNPYYRCPSWTNRRSIPAPAGEPLVFAGSPDVLRVYPRACGGTMNMSSVGMSIAGLSPRLRGNHQTQAVRPVRMRSIPAPAGEPSAETYHSCR